jgi:hypothetical protein
LPAGEIRHRHWKGDSLTAADLISFLSDNGALYAATFEAQRERRETIAFGQATLVRVRYPLNQVRLLASLGVPRARRAEIFEALRIQAATRNSEDVGSTS